MRLGSGAGEGGGAEAHVTCLPPKVKSGSESMAKLTCFPEGPVGKRKGKRRARHPANVTLLPLYASRLLSEGTSHGSYRSSLQTKRPRQDKKPRSSPRKRLAPSGSICVPDGEPAFHLDYVSLQTHDNLCGGHDRPRTRFTEAKAQRGAGTRAKVLSLPPSRGGARPLPSGVRVNLTSVGLRRGKCHYVFAHAGTSGRPPPAAPLTGFPR